ncbi:hypothetical protein Sste5346_010217 [Sporothrix stenoceras]|uniref:Uncharacterized protein n=1 Tax=Sporothrix stenoceras TaxID=5173 RepID=A0ABR3YGL1_9PEZI
MAPSALVALVVSGLPFLAAAAADNMLTLFGPASLDNEVSSTFLACVNATGVDYGVFVEDAGGAVVVPMDQRQLDVFTTDAPLMQCIEASNDAIYVSAESTAEISAVEKGAVSLDAATFEWLVSSGVTGKQAVGTRPAATPLTSKRGADAADITQTYSAYLDTTGKHCTDHDHHTYQEKECHGVRQQYKSSQFENTHGGSLHMEIWPHHDCKKGDSRAFVITGLTVGTCNGRDTYSWNGHY